MIAFRKPLIRRNGASLTFFTATYFMFAMVCLPQTTRIFITPRETRVHLYLGFLRYYCGLLYADAVVNSHIKNIKTTKKKTTKKEPKLLFLFFR
jgi:hypothetical protein